MKNPFFVTIDFDGTVTRDDVTDTVLKGFADRRWLEIECMWEQGAIGSKECLDRQIRLIHGTMDEVLACIGKISLDPSFNHFIDYLQQQNLPFAVISDGFRPFITYILMKAGVENIPIYANELTCVKGAWTASFPYHEENCTSGICKCHVATQLGNQLPIVHIGDGRSDFCLAKQASFVFAKGKLANYCTKHHIPHIHFHRFREITERLERWSTNTHDTILSFPAAINARQ